jgi:hypothetical protein
MDAVVTTSVAPCVGAVVAAVVGAVVGAFVGAVVAAACVGAGVVVVLVPVFVFFPQPTNANATMMNVVNKITLIFIRKPPWKYNGQITLFPQSIKLIQIISSIKRKFSLLSQSSDLFSFHLAKTKECPAGNRGILSSIGVCVMQLNKGHCII